LEGNSIQELPAFNISLGIEEEMSLPDELRDLEGKENSGGGNSPPTATTPMEAVASPGS
jgi:hypothetical protein